MMQNDGEIKTVKIIKCDADDAHQDVIYVLDKLCAYMEIQDLDPSQTVTVAANFFSLTLCKTNMQKKDFDEITKLMWEHMQQNREFLKEK